MHPVAMGMSYAMTHPTEYPLPNMPQLGGPEVTVLVPALNEEHTIAEVVDRVLALPLKVEVIVIDDGSTDNTTAILAAYKDRVTVLRNEKPTGKGSAIRQALPFARRGSRPRRRGPRGRVRPGTRDG